MRPALIRFPEIPSCSSRNATSCSCSSKSESGFRGRNDYSKSSSSSSARRNTTRRRRRKKFSSSSSSSKDSDDEKKTKSEENSLARVGIETRMKNASVGALAALTLSLGGNPTMMMMMTPSTSVAYASTGNGNGIENTAKRTGDCLLQNCKAELAGCLADEKCVESLACLNVCFGKPDEADCQIRCGDLYASPAVQKFNTCAVTRNACVAQRQSTGEYPVPDFDAIETK